MFSIALIFLWWNEWNTNCFVTETSIMFGLIMTLFIIIRISENVSKYGLGVFYVFYDLGPLC